jgi:hypothetical protein
MNFERSLIIMPEAAVAEAEKPKTKKTKLPRQEQLPGVENRAIKEIEDLAMDYAEVRDERMKLSTREVELKTDLIAAMHKAKRTEYRRQGIDIELTVEKEKIKVKVKKDAEEE